jgi:protoporphyrinogen oxidase
MLWEAAARKIRANGGEIAMGERVISLTQNADDSWSIVTRNADGKERHLQADHVISSMPVRELMQGIAPAPAPEAVAAARGLRYRDFLVVSLIVKDRNLFDDNWIYIHDPDVKVGRIQNFKSWSPEMVPDPSLNCYGMEYFCFEGDGVWAAQDADLVKMASDELVKLDLAKREDIVDGVVVRQPKAYPVYDDTYQERVETIRAELEESYPNLHLVGRNGMHKYNNQDHAMMTAMLTVKNILLGRREYDVWCVNQDAEYHEEGEAAREHTLDDKTAAVPSAGRLVPAHV